MSERPPVLSWPVAAGIISALLVVVLGGGWLLTRATRQAPGGVAVLATATTSPRATTAPTARPERTSMPTVGTSKIGTPEIATTAVRTSDTGAAATGSPEARTSAAGTPAALASDARAFSSGAQSAVTYVALPTLQPTASPRGWWDASSDVPADARTELEQAYAHFWEVRGQALLDLDQDRLPEVMAGPELTAEQQAIQDLQANGQAQRVDVEHHERVSWATADAATILDEYVSHTVLVDAETKEPLEDPPSAPFRLAFLFRKVDGRWLAVDAVRVTYAQ